jgi:hypothetical protein
MKRPSTRKHKFRDVMNIGAPEDWKPGSPEWANAVANQLRYTVERADKYGVDDVIDTLDLIDKSEIPPWKVWPSNNPCGSCGAFLELTCERTVDQMKAFLEMYRPKEKPRFLYAVAEESQKVGTNRFTSIRVDNINSTKTKGGDSSSYLLGVLKRDHKDIAEDYRQGKFKSVRAAALQAGIVKKRISVLVDTPENALRPLIKKFGIARLEKAFNALRGKR